ncbi:MAG: hypothetical protein ABJE47_20640 [bacterium]
MFSARSGAQRAPTPAVRDSLREAAADTLAARLRRAEEAIALLQQQLGEQTASGVSTRSRMQLEVNGRVVVNSFRNERRVNNVDDPQFVRPDSASALAIGSLGMAIRQTSLGAVLNARDVLGGHFIGDIDVDFYGGQQPSSGGRTFPLLRIRTARGTVRWAHGEFMVGQESPLIAGLNPLSPAAVGTPNFVTAGNLWLWLPQIRGTIEAGSGVRIALQGAVLAPTTGDAAGAFDTDADPAERSEVPASEARVRVRWGEDDRASEIGCGGHLGYLALPGAASARTYAAACDARVIVVPGVELRGEGYSGRGLRGLGGGGISQNVNRAGGPLDDRGGWAQVNVDMSSVLRIGGGCGADEPREADVPAGGRLRNQSCAGYALVRPTGPMFVGAEVRRITTRYTAGSVTNNHLNLAVGFEF